MTPTLVPHAEILSHPGHDKSKEKQSKDVQSYKVGEIILNS